MGKPTSFNPLPATQSWVHALPIMQQCVLLSAVRGPDGFAKRHPAKALVRWYRRCLLVSAFDQKVLETPWAKGGGDFTGPSCDPPRSAEDEEEWRGLKPVVDAFVRARDEMGLHYYAHAMHAFQVMGYKHPNERVRAFWYQVYVRMVYAIHAFAESEEQMDLRLSDDPEAWKARSDEAGSCST